MSDVNFSVQVFPKPDASKDFNIFSFLCQLKKHFDCLETKSIRLEDKYFISIPDDKLNIDLSADHVDETKFPEKMKKLDLSLDGTVDLVGQQTVEGITTFISSICGIVSQNEYNLIVALEQQLMKNLIVLPSDDSVTVFPSLTSFTFGNLINGNRFVHHLNDLETKDGLSLKIPSEISAEITQSTKQLALQFKLTHCSTEASMVAANWCKLVFDFNSIKDVIFCSNGDEIAVYLRLDYSPKFFVRNQVDNWVRKVDFDPASREIIGKSRSIKLALKPNDNGGLLGILGAIYSVFGDRKYQFKFAAINDYCINGKFNLSCSSFDLKYALECVTSLSFELMDDLIINDHKSKFQSKLRNQDSKEVSAALFQLFHAFKENRVFFAYEKFIELLASPKANADCHQMKKVLVTPFRTIYLPPKPVETKFVQDSVRSERMLMIHVRDDNASNIEEEALELDHICESEFSQLLKNSAYFHHFLSNICTKRLFKPNGSFGVTSTVSNNGTTSMSIATLHGWNMIQIKKQPVRKQLTGFGGNTGEDETISMFDLFQSKICSAFAYIVRLYSTSSEVAEDWCREAKFNDGWPTEWNQVPE